MPPTKFDQLYEDYADGLPLAYLRALSYKESRMDPNARHPDSGATGLFQITRIAVRDYNQNNPGSYSLSELTDPEKNTEVATWLMHRIIRAYNESGVSALRERWHSEEWIRLLTAGWNSGWGAVISTSKWLKNRGISVTHDNVFAHAGEAGAPEWLQDPGRQQWQREVAELYFEEGGPDSGFVPIPAVAGMGTPQTALLFGLAAAAGWAIWRHWS